MTDLVVVTRSPTIVKANGPAVPVGHGSSHAPGGTDELANTRWGIRRHLVTIGQGLLAETCQRGGIATSAAGTSGQVTGAPVYLFAGEIVNSLQCSVSSAGVSNTLVKMGVCDVNGSRTAISADVSASFTSTGDKDVALTGAWTVPVSGWYYLLFIATGGTIPGLARFAGTVNGTGAPFGSGTVRTAIQQTGQTDIPPTVTIATNNVLIWMACR